MQQLLLLEKQAVLAARLDGRLLAKNLQFFGWMLADYLKEVEVSK